MLASDNPCHLIRSRFHAGIHAVLVLTASAGAVFAAPLVPNDPSVAGSLQLALTDAATTYDAVGETWADSSGKGRDAVAFEEIDLVASLLYDPPTLVTISGAPFSAGNVPALRFSGTADELMKCSSLNGGSGMDSLTIFSAYVVTNLAGPGTDTQDRDLTRPLGIGSSSANQTKGTNYFNLSSNPSLRKDNGQIAESNYTAAFPSGLFIRVSRMDAGGVDEWFNTSATLTKVLNSFSSPGLAPFTTGTDDFFLGDLRSGFTKPPGLTGQRVESDFDIVQVLVYNTALTDAQIGGINEWMTSNLGAALPGSTGGNLKLTVANAANGSDLVFSWNSSAGKIYNLRASDSLVTDPATWPVVVPNIATDPPSNTEVVARPAGTSRTFYVVEELPL